jgi:hypothetical protein
MGDLNFYTAASMFRRIEGGRACNYSASFRHEVARVGEDFSSRLESRAYVLRCPNHLFQINSWWLRFMILAIRCQQRPYVSFFHRHFNHGCCFDNVFAMFFGPGMQCTYLARQSIAFHAIILGYRYRKLQSRDCCSISSNVINSNGIMGWNLQT